MKTGKLILIVTGLFLFGTVSFAQPSEEHTLTYDELMMKEYPADPDAVAVCLYSLETVSINYSPGYGVNKIHHVKKRIKILKEDGKDYANFVFYRRLDYGWLENLRYATAITYNIKNYNLEEIPMSPKYLFQAPYSDSREKVSMTAEGVEVGSVIDFEYELESNNWAHIDDIYFQMDIPVVKSIVRISYPRFTNWNKKQGGYRTIKLDQYLSTETIGTAAEGRILETIIDRMTLENLEAFHKESFCYCPNIFKSYVSYDLKEYIAPGQDGITKVQQSWDDIDGIIRHDPFYRSFKAKSPFSKQLQTIMSQEDLGDREKIEAAIKTVRSKVKWNGENNYVRGNVSKAIKKGSGNNVELNCLVGSALNTMGYKCCPVMVPLRNFGQVATFQPSINSFQVFILCIETPKGERYFADASLDAGWLNILAPEEIASNARIIPLSGKSEWIDLVGLCTNQQSYMVGMKLNPDGSLDADAAISFSGECSYDIKNRYYLESDHVKTMEKTMTGNNWEVSSAAIENVGTYSPATNAQCSLQSKVQEIDGKLYIIPFVKAFHNPLDMPDRERWCNIELPYPEQINYNCSLTIPEGYRVAGLPKAKHVICPALAAEARVDCTQNGDSILLHFTYSHKAIKANRDHYPQIRYFWENLSKIYTDAIVLERI